MFQFVGAARMTLDEKFRVTLPKRAHEQIEQDKREIYVTASPDGCLLILDSEALQEVVGPLMRTVLGTPRERVARRLLLGHAESVAIDKSGRLVVPDGLRTFAGLQANEQVFVIGQGRYLEVWDAEKWKAWVGDTKAIRELFDAVSQPGGNQQSATA
jgi:MraZ protein